MAYDYQLNGITNAIAFFRNNAGADESYSLVADKLQEYLDGQTVLPLTAFEEKCRVWFDAIIRASKYDFLVLDKATLRDRFNAEMREKNLWSVNDSMFTKLLHRAGFKPVLRYRRLTNELGPTRGCFEVDVRKYEKITSADYDEFNLDDIEL